MVRWSINPIGGSVLVVAAIAAVLLLLVFYVQPTWAALSTGRKRLLALLRIVVVILVALLLLRPGIVYTRIEKQPVTLLILADNSRSMSVPDEVDNLTRWEALRKVLTGLQPQLGDLARQLELRVYTFSDQPVEVPATGERIDLPEDCQGKQTAIGATLQQLLQQHAGKRLLAAILLSDGAENAAGTHGATPQQVAEQYRQEGCPIYTIRFGQPHGLGRAFDAAVVDLQAPRYVFVENRLVVQARIRTDGLAGKKLPVELLWEVSPGKLQPIQSKQIAVSASQQYHSVQFEYEPDTPGEFKLAVNIPAQQGELVKTNNSLASFVRVLKGGISVLLLDCFPPRPEQKFLRRALETAGEIDVDLYLIDPFLPQSAQRIGDKLQPGNYEVFILGDLPASVFTEEQLQNLAQAVSEGTGLLLLGGKYSFGGGGYATTPLASLLPTVTSTLQVQPLEEPVRSDLHLPGPLQMLPSQIGLQHYVLRLSDDATENQTLWKQLPPLDGANLFDKLKPAAVVLAESPQNQPLLVYQPYGQGRVVAFAADSTWHWVMQGFEKQHARFWRQLVIWLARKDTALESKVWVKLDKRRIVPGTELNIELGAETPDATVRERLTWQLTVEGPNNTVTTLTPQRTDDKFTATFSDTSEPGEYTVRAKALLEGTEIGSASARFVVYAADPELDNPAANHELLRTIAQVTGGQSFAASDLPKLLDELSKKVATFEVTTETEEPLWDNWPMLLAIVLLLGLEWFLRRYWGMV